MDKLVQYREFIKKVMTEYANYGSSREGVERELILQLLTAVGNFGALFV